MDKAARFNDIAEKKVFDDVHRSTLRKNIGNYNQKFEQGKNQFANLNLAKARATSLRNKAIENLEKYLIEFEANFIKRGGKVIWACDAEEANREILQLLKSRSITSVIKSKSMVTEEIGLNGALKAAGVEPVETDLGEYIQQLSGEAPYHIVTPAMHKSKEEVAKLFAAKKGLSDDSTPQQVMNFVRGEIRTTAAHAGAGITGANFLLADCGGVAVTENEGNALMSMAGNKLHIVVTGIEKIIPSIQDLDLFWPLLATYGTGQLMTVYNSIVFGPRQPGEQDGPEEMVLVYATTLCGKCTEVCPVGIDLHKLMLYNRRDAMTEGFATKTENVMWFFWKGAMLKRSKMDKGGAKLKNFMLRQFFRKSWGERREMPNVANKSFNQLWRERKGIK